MLTYVTCFYTININLFYIMLLRTKVKEIRIMQGCDWTVLTRYMWTPNLSRILSFDSQVNIVGKI